MYFYLVFRFLRRIPPKTFDTENMARNTQAGNAKLSRAPKHVSFADDVASTFASCPTPSGSSNRKRKASPVRLQNAPGSKHIRIQQKPIEVDEDDTDDPYRGCDEEPRHTTAEDSDCVEIKPPPRADRCRSLSTIPDKLQGLVRCAQDDIANYTLFTKPFLSPVEILFLLSDAWERAQDSQRRFELKTKSVDAYVSNLVPTDIDLSRKMKTDMCSSNPYILGPARSLCQNVAAALMIYIIFVACQKPRRLGKLRSFLRMTVSYVEKTNDR